MGRGDLTNGQWERLEPLLPVGKKPGRPWTWTRRQLMDGIRLLQAEADVKGLITWDVNVDWTIARAHQHAAEASKRGDLHKEPPGGVDTEPDDHGLGRSRGGLTTKLHLAVEQGQKPLSLLVTVVQWQDSPRLQPVLDAIRVPRTGPGRPRTKPDRVRADRSYGSRANRAYLRRRGVKCDQPFQAAPRVRVTRVTRHRWVAPTTQRHR
ncbi:transposase [Streptomyces sp. NBC_01198]|uniref:transposase n=1 Tax=Streptomyces sp. NBC_01198 TaxID=2903769 RepID=UPI002E1146BC|nr:transposase [Streptomyces sp. NBC_01198]